MMQIYTDAINASRVGDKQYVLQRSLDFCRLSDENQVLDHLKDGWDIKGEFINGAGYETYRLHDENHINILIGFLQNKFGIVAFSAEIVHLSFQEFFANDCTSEGINVDILFWNSEKKHENIRVEEEKARAVRDLLTLQLFVKQYKDSLIKLLEKKRRKTEV